MHGSIEAPKNKRNQSKITQAQKLSTYGIGAEHPRQIRQKHYVTIKDFLLLKPPNLVVILPPTIIPKTGPVIETIPYAKYTVAWSFLYTSRK